MHRIVCAVLALALVAGRSARAETGPGPAPSAATSDTSRWSFNGELAFTDVSGNSSLSLLTMGLGAKRAGGRKLELSASGSAKYGKSNGDLAASSYGGEVSARLSPRGRVSPFFTGTALHDRIRNLDVRLSLAAGAQLNVIRQGDADRLSVGLAVLEDYEHNDLPPGAPADSATITSTRFDLRLGATVPLRTGVALEHATSFQPTAGDLGDYLLVSKTSFRVALTRVLALQTSYLYTRDATPPPGVLSKDDRTLTTGLLVELK